MVSIAIGQEHFVERFQFIDVIRLYVGNVGEIKFGWIRPQNVHMRHGLRLGTPGLVEYRDKCNME